MPSLPRQLLSSLGIALALCLIGGPVSALGADGLGSSQAVTSEIGHPNPAAISRLGVDGAPSLRYAIGDGTYMRVASLAYDRAQVSPLVGLFDSLPHGAELAQLKLYVATDEEIAQACGVGTMACYDPGSERMIVSGQSEEVAGIPRQAVIAHEYGHHIANNRRGDIWSALSAGTPRWSTYVHVCELARGGQVFPGDEGAHYWENPGEAFAQSYSQMVVPQANWYYTPLLRPDETALTKLRMDVLHPWREPLKTVWRKTVPGEDGGERVGVGPGVALGPSSAEPAISFRRPIKAPVDGRIRIRLRPSAGRYSLVLSDPASGEVLASSAASDVPRLSYSDCGHRSLTVEAIPAGEARSFEAVIVSP